MATRSVFRLSSRSLTRTISQAHPIVLRGILLVFSLSLCSLSARAQFQSPFVFTADPKGVAVYTRNDVTGILTPVPGSPFPGKEPVNVITLDFAGRFLFTASYSPSKISMFTVDPNTGALQEVLNSPFASLATNTPVFLSTENTGQFLYVINFNGSQAGASSLETFQIDAANLELIPSQSLAIDLPGLFLSGATHRSGKSFYAFLHDTLSSIPNQGVFLLFDSSTGKFTLPSPNMGSSAGTFGCCLALDPQGNSLALGVSSLLTIYSLQVDGTFGTSPGTGNANGEALSMAFDTFGRFLYVDFLEPPATSTNVHIFSPATLLETSNSPLPANFPSSSTWNVDPTAPLIYADQVYQVDPQTGIPSPMLSASPITKPAIFTQPPGSQPVLGPIAQLSSTSLSFGSLSLGQTSSALTLTITSDGGQALSLNTVGITGQNSSDFAITGDTCHAPTALQPSQSCSLLVSFTPSAIGNRSAAVTITDNASPPMESAALSGTGLTPAPAVTLIPGSLDFGTLKQGTSTSLGISVENSGTATLHITNVVLGGANANDYSFSSPTCSSPIAVNSSCTVIVTFTPLAPGVRSAIVTISDDAPGSPQTISLSGTGGATAAAITFSPVVPSFPTITQGTLSPAQSLTVISTGTGPLHVSSVTLGGSNPSEFTFISNCTAPVAPSASCTISLVFNPIGAGQRAANLVITDDAPGSPQTISLSATANPAFLAGPAPGGAMTASISAGQTAQFQLQLTPGPGYSGTVSLSCSGAPLAATCHVPPTVSVSNGAAAPFTVTVSTNGSAMVLPSPPRRFAPPAGIRLLLLLALALVLVKAAKNRWTFDSERRARRLSWSGAVTAVFLCSVILAAGCGTASTSNSASLSPPPVVTPSGTSTIIVTPTAVSSTGQPLQLMPIQLTLIVK